MARSGGLTGKLWLAASKLHQFCLGAAVLGGGVNTFFGRLRGGMVWWKQRRLRSQTPMGLWGEFLSLGVFICQMGTIMLPPGAG